MFLINSCRTKAEFWFSKQNDLIQCVLNTNNNANIIY